MNEIPGMDFLGFNEQIEDVFFRMLLPTRSHQHFYFELNVKNNRRVSHRFLWNYYYFVFWAFIEQEETGKWRGSKGNGPGWNQCIQAAFSTK